MSLRLKRPLPVQALASPRKPPRRARQVPRVKLQPPQLLPPLPLLHPLPALPLSLVSNGRPSASILRIRRPRARSVSSQPSASWPNSATSPTCSGVSTAATHFTTSQSSSTHWAGSNSPTRQFSSDTTSPTMPALLATFSKTPLMSPSLHPTSTSSQLRRSGRIGISWRLRSTY